jgi:hypothetical protein
MSYNKHRLLKIGVATASVGGRIEDWFPVSGTIHVDWQNFVHIAEMVGDVDCGWFAVEECTGELMTTTVSDERGDIRGEIIASLMVSNPGDAIVAD